MQASRRGRARGSCLVQAKFARLLLLLGEHRGKLRERVTGRLGGGLPGLKIDAS